MNKTLVYRIFIAFVAGLLLATAPSSHAQKLVSPTPEPERTPDTTLTKLYHLEWLTRPDNQKLKENVVDSALGPFISRHNLVRSATMVERSRNFGVGDASRRAYKRPGLAERQRGSFEALKDYPTRDQDNAIRAGVFRHLFDNRNTGFKKDFQVQFVSVGEIEVDPDPDLIQALELYPPIQSKKLRVIPASHAIVVREDGIRDRFSGDYGPFLRVNTVKSLPDGTAEALASFTDGEYIVRTKVYQLEQVDTAWRVTSEKDYIVQ